MSDQPQQNRLHWPLLLISSETETRHELHLPWCVGSGWSGIHRGQDLAEGGSGTIILRPSILAAVEEAEGLGDLPSELQSQQELELTRCTYSYRSCIQRQIYSAEVGSRNEAIRVSKLRSVESIKHLGSELNLYLLRNRKAFGKCPIRLPEAGTSQGIAGNIAES